MPFFYSQYLKDEKPVRLLPGPNSSKGGASGGNQRRRSASNARRSRSLTLAKPSSLVWHSGTGASGKAQKGYKPLGYDAGGKRKVVHFSTIEVQPFHFDWSLANDIFYTRPELTVMGQSRFDDAAKLRQQRDLDSKGQNKSMDDVGISKKSKDTDIADLLAKALEDEDRDENVSIRGIEHFVYPGLQQEMIRKKKEVQKEVLGFVRSKRPDPQGWRLAGHSRSFSQWARDVALQKGLKYCMDHAASDPEASISGEELKRFQDDLNNSARSLRRRSRLSRRGAASFDEEKTTSVNALQGIKEDDPDVHGHHGREPSLEGDDYDSFLQALNDDPPSLESDAAASTPTDDTEIAADHKGEEDENSSCESQTAGGSTGED